MDIKKTHRELWAAMGRCPVVTKEIIYTPYNEARSSWRLSEATFIWENTPFNEEKTLRIWKEIQESRIPYWNYRRKNRRSYGLRDNKHLYNGGGGSNRSKMRVPSQKRSKHTWKNFLKLFPNYKGPVPYKDLQR